MRFGRMMFAGAVVYLIAAGIVGELQVLQVQAQEHAAEIQLARTQATNGALRQQIHYLRSAAGQANAVRTVLHFAPTGSTPLVVHTAP